MPDPILDRLFRHDAWATRRMIEHLGSLPEATLSLTAAGSFGTIADTVHHLVAAHAGYVGRVEGLPREALPWPARTEPVPTHDGLRALAAAAATLGERLRAAAGSGGDPLLRYDYGSGMRELPRSVVLAQAIHHATEHRAQVFATLSAHGIEGLTLDDLDVWAHHDAETGATPA